MDGQPFAAFNLSGLASALRHQRKHLKFADAVERYQGASSTQVDLSASRKAVLLLVGANLEPKPIREEIGAALQTHAIVMYCRGVVSQADGRRGIDILKAYDDDLRERHRNIADLRDASIAHFGKGRGDHGIEWSRERSSLAFFPNGHVGVGFNTLRSNFTAYVTDDLFRLLDVAIPFVKKEIERREEILRNEVERLKADPAIISLLPLHSSDVDPSLLDASCDGRKREQRYLRLSDGDFDFIKSVFPNYPD